LLLLVAPVAAQAQFQYATNGGVISITAYTGAGGAVTISNFVTSIASEAFWERTTLTSVTIPNSVTNIGTEAFEYCYALTNVTIPASITNIASYTFAYAGLRSIAIPGSITNIAAGAFQGCDGLKWVLFAGNAPGGSSNTFAFMYAQNATVCYVPGTTWWQISDFCNLPVVLWNPVIQTGDGYFGVQSNQFGFNVTGAANIPVVVQACANLANPVWTPLQTVSLTNGAFYFSDAQWTNYPGRYYSISPP
jgi:hypothetical protein